MALSRFAYVRDFELSDQLLPGTFILLRIDGHAFHKCPLPNTPIPPTHPSTSQIHRCSSVREAQRLPRSRTYGSCRHFSHERVSGHRPWFWAVRRVQVSQFNDPALVRAKQSIPN